MNQQPWLRQHTGRESTQAQAKRRASGCTLGGSSVGCVPVLNRSCADCTNQYCWGVAEDEGIVDRVLQQDRDILRDIALAGSFDGPGKRTCILGQMSGTGLGNTTAAAATQAGKEASRRKFVQRHRGLLRLCRSGTPQHHEMYL